MNIVLIHGYNVTSTRTYGVLPHRLKSLGHQIRNVYLGKYVTLDNDLSIHDVVRAFQAALVDALGARFDREKFACITHSTGGLVVRQWIETTYGSRMKDLPISHLIMLAPPNHGSRLAKLGKSRLSRLRSLWGVEPGLQVLDGLEVGSRLQWELNSAWVKKRRHAAENFYPVVISGQWIDKEIWDVIVPATYERGSDGVVRLSSANLNMRKLTVNADGDVERGGMEGVPFLVPPKTAHSDSKAGVMGGIPRRGENPVFRGIVEALNVKSRDGYRRLEAEFALRTVLLQRREKYHDGTPLDRYSQIIFRVRDTMNNHLKDYAIELMDGAGSGQALPPGFMAHRHRNTVNPELFTFYVNYDKLSRVRGEKIGFRVQSVPDSPLVAYDDCVLAGPSAQFDRVIKPNQTTYIDVTLRRKLNKQVFRLTKRLSIQKITGKPGSQWIGKDTR